jgi:ubiquinone biosynthesis protein Coq4
LQAFGLAQLQFPYFAMWLSVTTTRMTYINPNSITSAMDAISAGWTLGRNVANIQCEKWETMLDQPLAEVRARYGITGSPSLRVASLPSTR